MSYSNTVTQEDLKNVLNEVLPQSRYIQSWEYVGDVYWWGNTWTVPDDGFIEVYVEPSASNWYWRISDSKAPDTGWSHRLTGANALTVSQEFFVKKGAVLGTSSMDAVNTAHVYYYKFTLKETTPESAVDYIVEQGTDGIWTYRKWNSGIAECWGINSASVTCSVISSPWIRGSMNNINFPSSLFNDTPLVMLTGFNAEWVSLASHSKDAISTIYIYTVATGTSTRSVRIHAIGTWK